MAEESKKWYQSKVIWCGIISAAIAAYNSLLTGGTFHLPVIPEFVYGILAALGIYGRATATTVIK